MIDLKSIDDLARRLSELVPPGLKAAGADLEQNMKATLQAGLARLDLVTSEEIEVQRAVQVLEAKLAAPPPGQH